MTDYNANPKDVKNYTQSSEVKYDNSIQDYSEFLPPINRSESLQRFFGSTVNQLLSKGSTMSINAYWGRLAGRNYNPDSENFNLESDSLRFNYQFQPGVVLRLGNDVKSTTSYVSWLRRLNNIGADISNHDRLFSEPGYVLDLPINIDMFVNYENYYWLEGQIPLIEIEATENDPIDIDDITKRSQYTTGVLANYKTVEFVNGLRVKFTGSHVSSSSGNYFPDYIYYVENVGSSGGIKLIPVEDDSGNTLFPEVTPYHIPSPEGWDIYPWDSTSWSDGESEFEAYDVTTINTRDDLALNKSYIVMERWASDKNPWARSNKWFSIHALRIATEYNNLDLEAYLNKKTRAKRPIIEFRANIELHNFCKNFVELVNFVIDADQAIQMTSGVANYNVDPDNAVKDGDIVLVASDLNQTSSSYYANSYVVSGVGSNITLTLHRSYNENDYVIVNNGSERGQNYCYLNGEWSKSQNKDTKGSPPLFALYDQNLVALDSYDDNNFSGDKIFGYKESSSGVVDNELGFAPSYTDQGSFSNYEFEWTLSNTRYTKKTTEIQNEEIVGFYFYHDWVKDEYHNGWSNIRGSQRVPVIQTQIADGINQPVFELGTESLEYPVEYTVALDNGRYRWYDHSYIDRNSIGYANPEFVWKYDTQYVIHDLISDPNHKLEFVDPYGNTHSDIVVTTATPNIVNLTINSTYPYEKIIYRSQVDYSNYGEIFLSNSNQKRINITINGQKLVENDDYTISGTTLTVTHSTEENDVIELMYVADADLENVVYDVAPVHFYNSDNKPFTGAGYDDLITHLTRQVYAMPGFEGSVNGVNNYHKTLRQHTYDGLIRQQIYRTKNIQYLLDQESINPVRALKNFARDYETFKKSFRNKIKQLWTTESWTSVRELVDRALSDINIGRGELFKYAYSDMAYYKQSKNKNYQIVDSTITFELPEPINKYGDTQNHLQVFLKEYDGTSRYIEKPLVKNRDYTVNGNTITLASPVTLDSALTPATLTLRWYDYKQVSGIPFSPVKLGFYKPTQVEVVDGEVIGHDGSHWKLTNSNIFDMESGDFDVVGAALYDFELRIFNNLVDEHFVSDDLGNDMMDFYPSANSVYPYDVSDFTIRLDDWFTRYALRNNITEIDDRTYDASDEFTWNYSSVSPYLGSWRALYVHYFGTDRPHTHPWEMLGHRVKPSWWDTYYDWAAGPKRNALIEALKYGKTGNATTPEYYDIRYARSAYDWSSNVLVSDDGLDTLYGPVTAGVVASPAAIDAAKKFEFGDWSEIENDWRKSSEYKFAIAEVLLQLRPYKVHETFWKLNRIKLNKNFTQEQWIDVDTCMRSHNDEIHCQQITDGIIDKVIVEDGGSGYTYLNLDFNVSPDCYNKPSVEVITDGDEVVAVTVTNPGRGIISLSDVVYDEPVGASGVELDFVIDQNFVITLLGFNTLPAEEFRVNIPYTNELYENLKNLDLNYIVHVGGFTDKRIMTLELDGDYESDRIRLPENSYNIILDSMPIQKAAFYSGVKITKIDGQGYQVEGYNLDSGYFYYLKPFETGNTTTVNIGNTTVIKHTTWKNELYRIPYKTVFTRRQELYQFLIGLGQYYNKNGFDVITQWENNARDAIEWALSSDTEPFYVNGIGEELVYRQGEHGVVQTISTNYDGVPNVLDKDYQLIKQNELYVLRNDTTTEFSLKTGENKIYGLGIQTVEYEHVITIDNITTFNDPIYQPEIGLGQNRIKLNGERTRNWNGRIEAPGYLVKNNGIILNFESSVRELENDWVTAESKALERITRQTIGHNVGYVKPTYMTNMFIGDHESYRFETGVRKYKGTETSISAMSRNKNIFGEEFDYELHEEWMVRLGDYGDKSERDPLQFVVDLNNVKSDPQHFRFNDSFVSDRLDDLIIDLHKGSKNAISGNFSNPFPVHLPLPLNNTSIETVEEYQNFTRDAGLPLVDEIDYFLGSIDDIGDIYDPTQEYALIPNWSENTAYVKGDLVRRYGYVYKLKIDSTGLDSTKEDIVVRGNQVYPIIENGATFIANGYTVTFSKSVTSVDYDDVVVDGTVTNPTIPSGETLVIDGVNVNFIKTQTTTNYSDIVLEGDVINPVILNSATRVFTIGYADNLAPTPLTTVDVYFNELDPNLTMQEIWVNALTTAGHPDPVTETNNRIQKLENLRSAYIAANSVAAWETFVGNYYDTVSNPDKFVNPEYLGSEVNANPGASWETAARDLIDLDLDLITALGGTHSETQTTMVSGVLNDLATFDAARDATNNLLDHNVTPNDDNQNLQDFRTFVTANGGVSISLGQEIAVTNPKKYVTDDLNSIITKITNALSAASAPSDITVSSSGGKIVITRTNNSYGYRLGVSTDTDLGFTSEDNDVQTSGTVVTSPVDLTLNEAVQAVNNAAISGVTAEIFNNKMRLTSMNQTLIIGNGTANDDLGFGVGTYTASPSTITVPVDLEINDIVEQINNANIPNLTASQVQGALILTYSGDTLDIGPGTANEDLGLIEQVYNADIAEIQNTFNHDDWDVVQDPAHFNIWMVDSIGSNPTKAVTVTNRYDVMQTVDHNIGILEICTGAQTGDDALITCDSDHTLSENDYVLIINSTCQPSVDGIHQVTGIQDSKSFYIDRFIEQKGFTGKVIPIRSVRFSNTSDAIAAMSDPKYVQASTGLRSGDFIYVDEKLDDANNSLGYGAVYTVERVTDGAIIIHNRDEVGKTNNSRIKNGILYDPLSHNEIIQYEVFDPLKGIIPGIADIEIDIRSDVDYAYYNNTTDPDKELNYKAAWGQEQVGMVWWDLSNAIYLNYDQSNPEYRQAHWGELFPTSTIDVYEWTKSPVTPDEYEDAVNAGTIIDGIELTGIPYSITDRYGEKHYNWSEEVEFNHNTNQVETYYYFWVKNKTTTPNLDRQYSVLQLAQIIQDPSSQQIDWIAASSINTLLVSSLQKARGYDNLIMQVNFNKSGISYHQEFMLLDENSDEIPEWLHISLRDSLSGIAQKTSIYEFEVWDSATTYSPGDVVQGSDSKFYRCHTISLNNDPVTDSANDFWMTLDYARINPDGDYNGVDTVEILEPYTIPDLSLHELIRYGINTRPHQIWFKDINKARKEVLEKINDQLSMINLIDSKIDWQTEFDKKIYVGDSEYNLRDYWNFIDWKQDDYDYDISIGDYFVETKSDLDMITPTEGEIAHVVRSNDYDNRDRHQVYKYEDGEWNLVFKEKATIAFNDLLWNNKTAQTGWDSSGWDTAEWDKNASMAMAEILDIFYYKIWVGAYKRFYSNLWFKMVEYVMREQDQVDWIFKSSYFSLVLKDSLVKKYSKFFKDNVDEFVAYVERVKPFRSKLRDITIQKYVDEDIQTDVLDTAEIRIQTNPSGSTVDTNSTRSFRLSVGNMGNSYSSQIVDSNKVLLAMDITSDYTVIPYYSDSGLLPNESGAVWINGERIEYTSIMTYNEFISSIGLTDESSNYSFSNAYDSSFESQFAADDDSNSFGSDYDSSFGIYSTVSDYDNINFLIGCVRGTNGTFARPHNRCDVIEGETGYELIENNDLSDWGDSITPAWQDLGVSLLDLVNTDANGITINANGFGMITPSNGLQSIIDSKMSQPNDDILLDQNYLTYVIQEFLGD